MDPIRWKQISSNLPSPLTISYGTSIGLKKWQNMCSCGGEEDDLKHPSMHAIHILQRVKWALPPIPIPMPLTVIYHTNSLNFALLLPNPAITLFSGRETFWIL
uniref:Uncharacterized protein n=1 Tax=Ananas comosus var. bracteatus TaxID=296719 RepID=A0A6V7PPU9_ANACO|nr:unnamed protein product [Ananas comosus var. bracteatus]